MQTTIKIINFFKPTPKLYLKYMVLIIIIIIAKLVREARTGMQVVLSLICIILVIHITTKLAW